jgi:mannan endo-1,4-beta-mannosidase
LAQIDYTLYKAAQLGLRIILTLTNNWKDFGGTITAREPAAVIVLYEVACCLAGMDQYIVWRQWYAQAAGIADESFGGYHDDFYNDPVIVGWYEAYAQHLITHVNTYTGVAWRDDPTIFAWELGNEPRCQGSGDMPSTNNCTLNYAVYGKDPVAWKIGAWVQQVSTFIRSIDPNHMIAVGDEGFFCENYQACPDTTCDCYYGVDTANFTASANISFMSLHLYPEAWGKDAAWGTSYIANHSSLAKTLGKPVLLGEFGYANNQHEVYASWTETVYSSGMNGDLFWMLAGLQDDGSWYPNYDTFGIYCPNATQPQGPGEDPQSCAVLSAAAQQMNSWTLH